jgi:hypothetical protein
MNPTVDNEGKGSFLAPVSHEQSGMLEVAQSRAAQEVQAQMVIAKKFRRNEIECIERIKVACQRKGLAELSMYSYPRGGQQVTGPSIRLAEVLAKSWGNMNCGIIELEQKDGESTMMAYAWDLETNTRVDKVFTVQHVRSKRDGNVNLTDPRDIYEMTANQGSRRLRACILSIIPIDVQDAAIEECEKTLKNQNKEPLKDRVTAMVLAFKNDFGVTQEMLEKRFGHRTDAFNEQEMVTLRKIYVSLRDNMSRREDWFDAGTPVKDSTTKSPKKENAAPTGNTDNPPAGTKDALYDPAKPLVSIEAMMRRDSVTEEQVVAYAKTLSLAGDRVKKVSEIREANLAKIGENWVTHLPQIQSIPAGE